MKRTLARTIGFALLLMAGGVGVASADHFKIEIDYMVKDGADAHSHMPTPLVKAALERMFYCMGHTIEIDIDDPLPHYYVLRRNPADCTQSLFDYDGSPDSYKALRDIYFDHHGEPGWHYCIFGHQFEDNECATVTNSGIAQEPGIYLLVSLGGVADNEFTQASTLAHEFGHNLGLSHCGGLNCNDSAAPDFAGSTVPTLASIMSYSYQLTGIRSTMESDGWSFSGIPFEEINYSKGYTCTLDENALYEDRGNAILPIDFDCDGTIITTPVAQDLNGKDGDPPWCGATGNRSVLSDYDEWAHISDPAYNLPFAASVSKRYPQCMDLEAFKRVAGLLESRGITVLNTPTLVVPPTCSAGRPNYLDPSGNPLIGNGRCSQPFSGLETAQAGANPNAVFVVRPGTYDETNGLILNQAGTFFCRTGSAVFR